MNLWYFFDHIDEPAGTGKCAENFIRNSQNVCRGVRKISATFDAALQSCALLQPRTRTSCLTLTCGILRARLMSRYCHPRKIEKGKNPIVTDGGAMQRRTGETFVKCWVERFDRRGTEPWFELFRSGFGKNSFKIQFFFRLRTQNSGLPNKNSGIFARTFQQFRKISTSSKTSAKIWRNFIEFRAKSKKRIQK